MHIFHSHENIKTCILKKYSSEKTRFDSFTGEKPLDWSYFFLFSQYCLRVATLYGISVSFLRETTIGVSWNCKQNVRVPYKLNKRKRFYKFVFYN